MAEIRGRMEAQARDYEARLAAGEEELRRLQLERAALQVGGPSRGFLGSDLATRGAPGRRRGGAAPCAAGEGRAAGGGPSRGC